MKDHEIAALVNQVRDIARQYHDHESLRCRMSEVLVQALKPQQYPACKGMNCGTTDGRSHSAECQAEHAAAVAGGRFVKGARQPSAERGGDESAELAAYKADYIREFGVPPSHLGNRWRGWQARAALASRPAEQPSSERGGAPSTAQINDMMRDAGWQNSAIRQADLPKVEKVVRAALASRPAEQPLHEAVLNACITYVVHGEADFSALPDGLSAYFMDRVDALRPQPSAPVQGEVKRNLADLWDQAGGWVPLGNHRPSERTFSGSLNTLARFAELAATPPSAQQAEQPAQGRVVRWCSSCGEGVTTFCRGKNPECPQGLPLPGAALASRPAEQPSAPVQGELSKDRIFQLARRIVGRTEVPSLVGSQIVEFVRLLELAATPPTAQQAEQPAQGEVTLRQMLLASKPEFMPKVVIGSDLCQHWRFELWVPIPVGKDENVPSMTPAEALDALATPSSPPVAQDAQQGQPIGWLPTWAVDRLLGKMGPVDWGLHTYIYAVETKDHIPIYLGTTT